MFVEADGRLPQTLRLAYIHYGIPCNYLGAVQDGVVAGVVGQTLCSNVLGLIPNACSLPVSILEQDTLSPLASLQPHMTECTSHRGSK